MKTKKSEWLLSILLGILIPLVGRAGYRVWDVSNDAGYQNGNGIWSTSDVTWDTFGADGTTRFAWPSITGDTVMFGGNSAIPSSGNIEYTVTVNGDMVLYQAQQAVGAVGNATLTGGTLTTAYGVYCGNGTFSADSTLATATVQMRFHTLAGSTLIIGGNNTFTNTAVVRGGGTVRLAGFGALGNSISVTMNTDANNTLDLYGNSFSQELFCGGAQFMVNSAFGTGSTWSGTVTQDSVLTLGGDGDLEMSGEITGNSGADLEKTGSGTLTLSGTCNTYGDITVSDGDLVLADTGEFFFLIGADGVNNRMGGSGSVQLDGEFHMNLHNASKTIGDSWPLVDDALAATYGSTFAVQYFTDEGGGIWTYDHSGTIYQFSEATGELAVTATNDVFYGSSTSVLYVATSGNDAWSGTLASPDATGTDGPFRSIEKAMETIRQMKNDGSYDHPVTVFLQDGIYRLATPLTFTDEDSGQAGKTITFKAVNSGNVQISGGVIVGGFERVRDSELWETHLSDVEQGNLYFNQLWVNGERRQRAKNPNKGFLVSSGPIKAYKDRSLADPVDWWGFRFAKGDINENWGNLSDVLVMPYHSWTASLNWIADVDQDGRIVTFTNPARSTFSYYELNQRYVVENYFEALDEPGEWYLNRTTGKLYYWPLENEDMATATVTVPRLEKLVVFDPAPLEYVEHLVFDGLSFQYADWQWDKTRRADFQAHDYLEVAGIFAKGLRDSCFENCEISHIGGHGIYLSAGCKDNVVRQCEITDIGGGGVYVGEASVRGGIPSPESRISGNVIDNNFIHDLTHVFHGSVGIWIGTSSSNTISHNEICDTDYTGISAGWCWYEDEKPAFQTNNIIEYNYIHHCGYRTISDMAGIYVVGPGEGSVIRNNVIHDIYCDSKHPMAHGIYADGYVSSGYLIENNVVCDVDTFGFLFNSCDSIVVTNNIIAFAGEDCVFGGSVLDAGSESPMLFERNIIYCTDRVNSSNDVVLIGGYFTNQTLNADHNIYYTGSRAASFTDSLRNNIDFSTWQSRGFDAGSVISDPGFADPAGYDFTLNPGSVALAMGFEPIDTSFVGLYGDAAWVDKPKDIERSPVEEINYRRNVIVDCDFESVDLGDEPPFSRNYTNPESGTIVVAEKDGGKVLVLNDYPGDPLWYPCMFMNEIYYDSRDVNMSFDYMNDADNPAKAYIGFMEGLYTKGPHVRFSSDGAITADDVYLASVPLGQWANLKITFGVGQNIENCYDVTLTTGTTTQQFNNIYYADDTFDVLTFVKICGDVLSNSYFYIDNLKISNTGQDADANGLPDWWELQYFGAPVADPDSICANGLNTLREAYIAGLNPLSSEQFCINWQPEESGLFSWNTVSGRVYSVWWTTNLLSGFELLESNIPWTRGSFSNQSSGGCGYYRIKVRQE